MSSLPNSTPTHAFVQIIDPRGVHATSLGLCLPFCFGKTQSCARHLVITRATWPLAARYGVHPDRKRLLRHGGKKGGSYSYTGKINQRMSKYTVPLQCRHAARPSPCWRRCLSSCLVQRREYAKSMQRRARLPCNQNPQQENCPPG
jgi:hypothetical protein